MDYAGPVIEDFEDEEDIEETLAERLIGLTEMFPDTVRNGADQMTKWTWFLMRKAGKLCQSALWIGSTTALVMIVPYAIEKERLDMDKNQIAQQRQMLLGPTAAVSAAKLNQPKFL